MRYASSQREVGEGGFTTSLGRGVQFLRTSLLLVAFSCSESRTAARAIKAPAREVTYSDRFLGTHPAALEKADRRCVLDLIFFFYAQCFCARDVDHDRRGASSSIYRYTGEGEMNALLNCFCGIRLQMVLRSDRYRWYLWYFFGDNSKMKRGTLARSLERWE